MMRISVIKKRQSGKPGRVEFVVILGMVLFGAVVFWPDLFACFLGADFRGDKRNWWTLILGQVMLLHFLAYRIGCKKRISFGETYILAVVFVTFGGGFLSGIMGVLMGDGININLFPLFFLLSLLSALIPALAASNKET